MGSRWGRRAKHVSTSTRSRVLLRDQHTCYLQLPGCEQHASQVDHIIPIAEGGTDQDHNLSSVCGSCHQKKSLREAQRGNARRRARGYFPAEKHPGLI